MDVILYLGSDDDKLPTLLERLGYGVDRVSNARDLPHVVSQANFDLVVLDTESMGDVEELCRFLRSYDRTRSLPIVCTRVKDEPSFNELSSIERVKAIPATTAYGVIAAHIAVQLRLLKLAGQDSESGNLTEINAALREYTSRIRKEIEEARTIQHSLLPEFLPQDPRFDLAVSYDPLDDVGGDWYDAQMFSSGILALRIADVTGHGLAAALLSSMVKMGLATSPGETPAEGMRVLNRILSPQMPPGRFVTVGSCCYDPETGKVLWARAGHPPALLYSRQRKAVIPLVGEGFPIGFFPDSSYGLIEETLEKGDSLLIFTDGITEARNRAGAMYGSDGLEQVLLRTAEQSSCREVLCEIIDDFDTFREERLLKDDITLLLLKRI